MLLKSSYCNGYKQMHNHETCMHKFINIDASKSEYYYYAHKYRTIIFLPINSLVFYVTISL